MKRLLLGTTAAAAALMAEALSNMGSPYAASTAAKMPAFRVRSKKDRRAEAAVRKVRPGAAARRHALAQARLDEGKDPRRHLNSSPGKRAWRTEVQQPAQRAKALARSRRHAE